MTVWTAADDGHADLSSHDSFSNGPPLNTFAHLRRGDPAAWCEYPQGKGFWSITRHADIMALNKDTELLSSAHGIRIEDQTEEEVLARRTFQELDPPDHTKVRRLLAKAFSGPVVQQFDRQIRDLCGGDSRPRVCVGGVRRGRRRCARAADAHALANPWAAGERSGLTRKSRRPTDGQHRPRFQPACGR